MDAQVYLALRGAIAQVAAGERTSTDFSFTWAELGVEQTTWTAAELGVTDCKTEAAKQAALAKISFAFGKVIDALLADCPYELYWYDKTEYTRYDSISFSRSSSTFRITSPG